MISEEDIKVGAVVMHLGSPEDWEDPEAIKDSHFVISDIHNSGGDYFTKDTVYIQAVKSNRELFSLTVPTPDITQPYRKELDTTCPFVVTGSIARPILAERKVGKVRMELVDDGFANALLEIAKVLTWAQEAKGYLDHDWVNLPDPENGFKGAASRHRVKANIQKMAGVEPKLRVDEESKLHHLAHQATNVLMELELILTGKIK